MTAERVGPPAWHMVAVQSMLEIENLHVNYRSGGESPFAKRSVVEAVRGVTLSLNRGETLAIVGESGSGKTSIAMSVLRFVRPASGKVLFEGEDIWAQKGRKLRHIRQKIQPVFQDTEGALNPRMTVGRAVEHGLRRLLRSDGDARRKEALWLFSAVGLSTEHFERYPHQLSGGQRQRICIARALAPAPELIVLDEPVSSQDISIQAQLINLLLDLKRAKGLTYLLISHDLRVVRLLADRVAVMRGGELVELGDTERVFTGPQHHYTQSLLENALFFRRNYRLF